MRFRTETSEGICILISEKAVHVQLACSANNIKGEGKKMKKLSVLVLTFIMVLAMAACGGNNGNSSNANTTDQTQNSAASDNSGTAAGGDIVVTIDIDYPDSSKLADVEDVKVRIPENSSVLDVLNKYADKNNVKIIIDDSSAPYVTSIGGVAATDAAGWVYEVNDETVMEATDKHIVKDGDDIEWSFESWNDNND